MPNPPLSREWVDRIWAICGAPPEGYTKPPAPSVIREILDNQERKEHGWESEPKVPSEKTIQRQVAAWNQLLPEDKAQYRVFRWPESMKSGQIPWEASRCLLDLLHFQHKRGRPPVLISFARWYWRASEAMPGAAIEERMYVASQLTFWEVVPALREAAQAAALESYLAYAPWRSKDADDEYQQAKTDGRIAMGFLITVPASASAWPPGADIAAAQDALRSYHWEEGNQMMIDYINASPESRSQALIAELQRTAEEEGEEA
jgi:hypothetical protein